MGGQVNVSVDASPSTDLNQVMSEIRDHYEGVIAKNRKDLESWYQNKVRGHSWPDVQRHRVCGGVKRRCACDVLRSRRWNRTS